MYPPRRPPRLGTAFCHEGYLPPSRQGMHCLGASYGPNDLGLDQRSVEHTANLAKLNALLPDLGFPDNGKHLQGHVALRCTSADYLPVAGPVPDREAFNTCYAEWRTEKHVSLISLVPRYRGSMYWLDWGPGA